MKHHENQHTMHDYAHDNALETTLPNILKGNRNVSQKHQTKKQKALFGLDQTIFFGSFLAF